MEPAMLAPPSWVPVSPRVPLLLLRLQDCQGNVPTVGAEAAAHPAEFRQLRRR